MIFANVNTTRTDAHGNCAVLGHSAPKRTAMSMRANVEILFVTQQKPAGAMESAYNTMAGQKRLPCALACLLSLFFRAVHFSRI